MFKDGKLHILNLSNKVSGGGNFGFAKAVIKQLKDISVSLYFGFGKKNDAFVVAMASQYVNVIVNSLLCFAKNLKPTLEFKVMPLITTKSDELMLTAGTKVKFVLMDILIAFFVYLKNEIKEKINAK